MPNNLSKHLEPPTTIEITRVANGFMLRAPDYARNPHISLSDTFVFNTLEDLVSHLVSINFELTDN